MHRLGEQVCQDTSVEWWLLTVNYGKGKPGIFKRIISREKKYFFQNKGTFKKNSANSVKKIQTYKMV